MPNPKLTPKELLIIQSDLEILRMMLNLIEALCYETPKLAESYMLDDVKQEIQYMVDTKVNQIKLDKRTHK